MINNASAAGGWLFEMLQSRLGRRFFLVGLFLLLIILVATLTQIAGTLVSANLYQGSIQQYDAVGTALARLDDSLIRMGSLGDRPLAHTDQRAMVAVRRDERILLQAATGSRTLLPLVRETVSAATTWERSGGKRDFSAAHGYSEDAEALLKFLNLQRLSALALSQGLSALLMAGGVLSLTITVVLLITSLAWGRTQLIEPVLAMSRAVTELAGGNREAPFPASRGQNEVGQLAQNLRKLRRDLLQTLQGYEKQLEVAHGFAGLRDVMAEGADEQEILLAATRLIQRLMDPDHIAIYRYDRQESQLEVAVGAQRDGASPPVGRIVVADSRDCPAIQREQPLLVQNREEEDSCTHARSNYAHQSDLCIPMTALGRTHGVLHIGFEAPGSIHPWMVDTLERLAAELAMALNGLRLLQALRLEATTDRLTGLPNARVLYDHLEKWVREAGAEGTGVVAIMLDVDHFKRVNDTFGHLEGDRVLRTVADMVRSAVPPQALIARYGGEEFVILAKGISLVAGIEIAERVRRAVSSVPTIGEGPIHFLHVTVSLGVSRYPDHCQNGIDLLKTADQALYQAKHSGRNRSECYGPAAVYLEVPG